jgi:hypothetical protein
MWARLATEFAHRGHEVKLLSRSQPGTPAEDLFQGVQHSRSGGYKKTGRPWLNLLLDLFYSLSAARRLPACDLVITNTFWLPVLLGARSPSEK